jgi:hypothetical protein
MMGEGGGGKCRCVGSVAGSPYSLPYCTGTYRPKFLSRALGEKNLANALQEPSRELFNAMVFLIKHLPLGHHLTLNTSVTRAIVVNYHQFYYH